MTSEIPLPNGEGRGGGPYLELISVIGHELRRPLTVIRGAATLMLDTGAQMPAERTVDMLQLIDLNVEDMSDLIEDLLLMVHIEARDLQLFAEPIQVADLVATALDAERRRLGQRPITVLGAAPGLTVQADRGRAVRALRCLLSNAARFSPADSPVEVSVRPVDDGVRVEVLDRGPGIRAGEREAVFERFRKSNEGGGLGLGLYLVRGLAHAMGGQAGVSGRRGGGAVVWFTLNRRG